MTAVTVHSYSSTSFLQSTDSKLLTAQIAALIDHGGSQTVIAGMGPVTIDARRDSCPLLVEGSAGSDIYFQTYPGYDTIRAGGGPETLTGGVHSTIVGGQGHDSLEGYNGSNTFAFMASLPGGSDTVQQFGHGQDIALIGFGHNVVNEVLATQHHYAGNISVSLPDGTQIVFTELASLKASDFVTH